MIKAKGIAHVTLTVADIERSHRFYEELFGTKLEFNEKWRSFDLLNAGIPCWFTQWEKTKSTDRFDETRVGLDHVAFEAQSTKQLKEIAEKLKAMKVKTEGVEKFANKYPYVCFRDPDNIQVEFFITNS